MGPPAGDTTWPTVVKGVEVALADAKRAIRFSKKQDRRGTFKTIATGLSYGGGQMVRRWQNFCSNVLSNELVSVPVSCVTLRRTRWFYSVC